MEQSRLSYLAEKYFAQQATAEEQQEFYEIVRNAGHDHEIKELMAQGWINFSTPEEIPGSKANELFDAIIKQGAGLYGQPAKLVTIKRWKWIAAAAVFLIIAGTVAFLFLDRTPQQDLTEATKPVKTDVAAPVNTRAVITLADGNKVYIDSAGQGILASQGAINIIKQADGQISYSATAVKPGQPVQYNTMSNPRGSKVISMVLDDGSKVWLNAGSSLTYPVTFSGTERNVTVNGEVYFEVMHNAAMPFTVTKNETVVHVLGTHFNVNAYDDETDIKITLMEGSVKITAQQGLKSNTQMLLPRQQAQVNSSGKVKLVPDVDMEETMAWKNGKFIFNGNDIQSVMRELERWYDVQVEYKGKPTNEQFVGVISRGAAISQILSMLEETRTVSFDIEGRKIIVK